MAKLAKFTQDLNRAKQGVRVDMGDGLFLTVARAGNEQFQRYMKEVLKPYEAQMRNKSLADEVFEKLYNEAIANTILLNWEGLEDDNGNQIPYSKVKAIELLSDKQYEEDFKKVIIQLSETQSLFLKTVVEQTKS